MKVVLAGPPRSGKSCLREGLKQALRSIPGAPYPYVITACPDGEGSWFQAAAGHDPARARELKDAYKASFTPAFVQRIADSVRQCRLDLVLVDIGGKVTPENHKICRDATHICILAPSTEQMAPWRVFADDLGLEIMAEIVSDYSAREDVVVGVSGRVLYGSVHFLERGEPVSDRPAVQALAQHIVSLLG